MSIASALSRPVVDLWRSAGGGVPPGAPRDPDGRRRRMSVRLAAHAAAVGLITTVLVVIWALTTRWYFWPIFPGTALGATLAIHAWLVALDLQPAIWRRPRMTRALATQLGLSLVLELYLITIWAATTRWYFWPAWPLLGLVTLGALHWIGVLVGRIDHLETTNVDAADLQELDRRRLERDLHDGAQARLIALGMSLGLAEQRFDHDPDGARELIGEARAGVTEAVQELRELVHGIRPPVLADRGLEAAVRALADRSTMTVDVTAEIGERPPDAIETAAYFVVAEAITNAAKHAGRAATVDVSLRRNGSMLRVEVTDDGLGGADDTGSGLDGLRRRVEAVDGTFIVLSPPGGPTIIRAELPCGR